MKEFSINFRKSLIAQRQSEQSEISRLCQDLEISSLWHFTNILNLETIFRFGLHTPGYMSANGMNFTPSDRSGRSTRFNGTSLSISWHNYKMFYLKTREESIPAHRLVLLEIDSQVLYGRNYLAFPTNSFHYENLEEGPLLRFGGSKAFANCFKDSRLSTGALVKRDALEIPKNYPTDPQAEIVLLEHIFPRYIKRICARQSEFELASKTLKESGLNISVEINSMNYRKDWEFWQGKNIEPFQIYESL